MHDDRSNWDGVAAMMDGVDRVSCGRYISYWFDRSPRRALFYTSYYKFAAKIIGKNKRVLDVGCSEGLGTWLLAAECGSARGVDLDDHAIATAQANWQDQRVAFRCGDFLEGDVESFDAVVNFDVIEHIMPHNADGFLARMQQSLSHDGIAIVGTPSLEGQRYASEIARAGHVNCYSGDRLEEEMRRHFHHVFLFSANDEIVHTGYRPMAHYLIAVGCRKRST